MSFETDLVAALPRLGRYALSLTREPDAARDLVQTTALKAMTAATPPPSPALLPWLIRIARNAFIDERRLATHRSGFTAEIEVASEGDESLRRYAVRQALARLEPACRSLVTLVDIEGFTYAEAAARLGIPVGTVMSRLSRARRDMLALLSDDDGGNSG